MAQRKNTPPVPDPEQDAAPEIRPAPVTLRRVSAFYGFLVEHLKMDEVLDQIHETANRPAGVPQSPAEALAYKAQQQQAAEHVSLNMGDVWRALASADVMLELAGILFARADGVEIQREDLDRIDDEAFFLALHGFASRSAQVTGQLVGSALGYG